MALRSANEMRGYKNLLRDENATPISEGQIAAELFKVPLKYLGVGRTDRRDVWTPLMKILSRLYLRNRKV